MRIFVSSTIDDLLEEREAVRETIEALGHTPFLVDRDTPASNQTPQEACMGGVARSDAFLGLIYQRYGFVNSESGLSIVEEEFNKARDLGLPVAWIKIAGHPEDALQDFEQRMFEYAHGYFRTEATSVSQLKTQVVRAVRHMTESKGGVDDVAVECRGLLKAVASEQARAHSDEPCLLVVSRPLTLAENDLLRLDSESLVEQLKSFLVFGDSKIFDIQDGVVHAKTSRGVAFNRTQACHSSERPPVEVCASGIAMLKMSVSSQSRDRNFAHSYLSSMVINSAAVSAAINRSIVLAKKISKELTDTEQFVLDMCMVNHGIRVWSDSETVDSVSYHTQAEIEDQLWVFDTPMLVGAGGSDKEIASKAHALLRRKFETAGMLSKS